MSKADQDRAMDELLKLWDWHRRLCDDDYSFGYTDAIGQCIINVGKAFGADKWSVKKQTFVTGYKFEAYKRVMEDTTKEDYWNKYPKPLASYFPLDEIAKNGGVYE